MTVFLFLNILKQDKKFFGGTNLPEGCFNIDLKAIEEQEKLDKMELARVEEMAKLARSIGFAPVKSKSLPIFFFNFQEITEALSNSGFQDPATSVMEGMLNLHHDLMFFMVLILIFVG